MQFSKNKQFIYFASIVVAFASLVRLDIHQILTKINLIFRHALDTLSFIL